ncbi:MAG: type II toxin-antitoxin system Phd/YefM family antitoxin [Candidatus Riflebacteria bacterium]|nr:type II toxin-antitoxin system Phd/YefM family antitoxin [Candidatus Riflebacteria bacterium]
MTTVAIEQAKINFLRLIDEVVLGEHIVITRNNIPVAEIVPLPHPRPKPTFGSAKGLIKMAENFDAPIEDFQDYTE